MKISMILDHIDSGHMALLETQRCYVWNRDQVRGRFDLFDVRRSVGALAARVMAAKQAPHRGYVLIAAGVVGETLPADLRALVSHVGAA
jgi:hypothetical protein